MPKRYFLRFFQFSECSFFRKKCRFDISYDILSKIGFLRNSVLAFFTALETIGLMVRGNKCLYVCKVRWYPLQHVPQYLHECKYWGTCADAKYTSTVALLVVFLKFFSHFEYIFYTYCTHDEEKLHTRRQAEDRP